MKRIFTFLAVVACCAMAVMAQERPYRPITPLELNEPDVNWDKMPFQNGYAVDSMIIDAGYLKAISTFTYNADYTSCNSVQAIPAMGMTVGVTHMEFDENRNMLSYLLTQSYGGEIYYAKTLYTYEGANRCVGYKYYESEDTTAGWDLDDNIEITYDSRGNLIRYSYVNDVEWDIYYDIDNTIIRYDESRFDESGGYSERHSSQYTYNTNGKVQSAREYVDGSLTYYDTVFYNAQGLIDSIAHYDVTGGGRFLMGQWYTGEKRTYYADGKLKSCMHNNRYYPELVGKEWEYDEQGRAVKVSYIKEGEVYSSASLEFDANGCIVKAYEIEPEDESLEYTFYWHKISTDLEATSGNRDASKALRNGQLIIFRNGHEYNVQGIMLK